MTSSYRTTLTAFRRFVKFLDLPWHKPQLGNLVLLGAAFFQERSLPLRRLARGLAGPTRDHRAPDKRLRRFLGNEKLDLSGALAALLTFLLPRFGPVPFVPVMLDWTFVGTTYAVLWAQIPYRGRSFPLLCRVYAYCHLGNTQHEIALLREIAAAWPATSPRPLLLADRGFPKCELLKWLGEAKWFFLIRAKQSLVVRDAAGHRVDLHTNPRDTTRFWTGVTVLGQLAGVVQVVVRTRTGKKGLATHWILVTNMPTELLSWATRLYRHRMQPEETHRDCKRGHFVGGFALAHLRRLRSDRLERLLFCVGICYAYLNLLAETDRETRKWFQRRHWGLSLITFALDLIHMLEGRLLAVTRAALASVQWLPLWLEDDDGPEGSEQPGAGQGLSSAVAA
jgi:hypothetical protein